MADLFPIAFRSGSALLSFAKSSWAAGRWSTSDSGSNISLPQFELGNGTSPAPTHAPVTLKG